MDSNRLYDSVGIGNLGYLGSRFSTSAGSDNREDDEGFKKMILILEIPCNITHDMIFNLCTLYGNVHDVWIHEDLKLALVGYECAS